MRGSLLKRLEALEARPVSPETLRRLRCEWMQTGIVPRAPLPALKMAAMFEAAIAELHAYVPHVDEERQLQAENHAKQLREVARNPTAWMGRELQLENKR